MNIETTAAEIELGDFSSPAALMRNPELRGWTSTAPGQVKHLTEFCPGWTIQHHEKAWADAALLSPLVSVPDASGLVLEARRTVPRIRILQRLAWPADFVRGRFRLSVRGLRGFGAGAGLSLDWAALLSEDDQQKVVFEDVLLRGLPIGADPTSFTVEYLKAARTSTMAPILALEFKGDAGSVSLAGIDFVQLPTAAARPGDPLDSRIVSVEGGRVTGWVRHDGPPSRVVLSVDGADVAEPMPAGLSKPEAKGNFMLRRFGFTCQLNPPAAIGPQVTIALRDEMTKLPLASLTLPRAAVNFPAVPDAVAAPAPAPRAPAEAALAKPLAEPEKGPPAGVDRMEGNLLLGWAMLDDGRTRVMLTVGGQVVGEAEAKGLPASLSAGNERLARNGFCFEIPERLLTTEDRPVAFYDALTGRRLKAGMTRMRFLEPAPPASKAPQRQAVAVPTPAPAPAAASLKVCVVSWDMAHNPVGRAFLLADMAATRHDAELVGATFAFYGGRIWPPIADSKLPMRSFPATDMKSFLAGAVELARNTRCDVVHVGKPRLPSLILGALIRHFNDCPMVVDIDDHELAFTKNPTPAPMSEVRDALAANSPEIDNPYSDLWTRFGETLVAEADLVTVSNVALRRRFGGVMVRHGRDERVFDPALYDRSAARAEFGFTDKDRVVLFLGTPRPHKGIFDIADALERLGDDRLVLCVIGTITDKRTANRFAAYKKARISLNPDQPWQRLPELVNLADGVCIMQDSEHAIAEFQIPAKLTDAMAMDVPVLARNVPPLEDLALGNAFEVVTDTASFDAALQRLAASPARQPGGGHGGRTYFLSELSYQVNAARLDLAYTSARQGPRAAPRLFDDMFRLVEARAGVELPKLLPRLPRQERRTPLVKRDRPRDLVFLWKQNDSDVYGRRSDMLAKYMLETGKVRRVIHFDRAISASALEEQAEHAAGEAAHQGRLVYVNTVRRVLGAADSRDFLRRTFLHRAGSRPVRAFGQELRPKEAYPDFVREVLREANVDEAPLLWVSPVIFEYPEIADVIKPGFVVADLIDDQRTFPGSSEAYSQRVRDAYATILSEADAVFGNCVPVQEAFADLRGDIRVVPNGAELLADVESWPLAPELRGLPRPIIGYVGNMRDRVDINLIEAAAKRFPEGSIVLVGSAHGRPEFPELARRYPNIHMLGVHPYQEAQRIMRGFDVAMMPHLKNDQSDRMNPLKLYVYFSVGVPVVTTDVANIDDIAPYISVAQDEAGFLDAIAANVAGKGRKVTAAVRAKVLKGVSWEARVNQIWRILEAGS